MGDAKHNPNSTQYTGPMPEYMIDVRLGWQVAPTQDWIDANKVALAGPSPPAAPPEACVVRFIVAGLMGYPSKLVPKDRWPVGSTPIATLAEMPFLEFKARIDAQINPPSGETKH